MNLSKLGNIVFRWILPLAVLGSAAGVFLLLGSQTKAKRKKAPPRVAIPVETVNAAPHQGRLKISASGLVVPFREVDLATEVGGKVIWKSDALLPGRFVSQGDVLLKIDSADYALEVSRLKQQLEKAEADLARAAVNQANASKLIELAEEALALRTRELERMKTLRQSRATSDSEFDEAEKTFVEAKQLLTVQQNLLRGLEAETKSLEATKRLAAVGLERAELDLSRTTIVAPFSGVVISHQVEANSHVQAGDTLARIEDTSQVEVRCSLKKQDLEFLPAADTAKTLTPSDAYRLPSLPATIRYTRAGKQYVWQGVLSRQDGLGMDEKTRTMPVRILVDQPLSCEVQDPASEGPPARKRSFPLVRGMFVQVDLHCTPDRSLIRLPEETIRPGKTVWIMVDNELKITPVQIARIESGIAYIDAENGRLTREHAVIRTPVPGAKEGLAVTTQVGNKKGRGAGGRKGSGLGKASGTVAGNRQAAPQDTGPRSSRPEGNRSFAKRAELPGNRDGLDDDNASGRRPRVFASTSDEGTNKRSADEPRLPNRRAGESADGPPRSPSRPGTRQRPDGPDGRRPPSGKAENQP